MAGENKPAQNDDATNLNSDISTAATDQAPVSRPPLSEAAKRALAEAEERRSKIDQVAKDLPKELGGRGGAEPVRYGDWEVKGITSDF